MGIAYNTNIVRDGLVLYLDAANIKSYPGTGTAWNDLSGNGNNGTLVNGTAYTTDNNGCMSFDGTNDYITLVNNQDTKLANPVQTISIMVFIRSVGPNQYAEIYAVSGNGYHLIKWEPSAISLGISSYFYSNFVSVTNNYNQWMEITCIINWESNTFSVYKNGNFINTINITPNNWTYTNPSTASIGWNRGTGNTGDFMNGNVGNVKIYNRALTANEIQQNFNAVRRRYGI